MTQHKFYSLLYEFKPLSSNTTWKKLVKHLLSWFSFQLLLCFVWQQFYLMNSLLIKNETFVFKIYCIAKDSFH